MSKTEAATSTTGATTERERRQALRATLVGNGLEWFDYTIYGLFATYIAKAMFDQSDPTTALLSTLVIFAVGFVARPIGGVFFGRMGDRIGRRRTIILTMTMMGASCLGIAILPGYDTIGPSAAYLLLAIRLLQGFAHAGESGMSYTYVAELAPDAKRGLWSSTVFMSVLSGSLLATIIGAVLTRLLTESQLGSWGWRIPFLCGAVLAVYVMYLRQKVKESDIFSSGEKDAEHVGTTGITTTNRRASAGDLIRLLLITTSVNVVFYMWLVFAVSEAIAQRGVPTGQAFYASVLAQLTSFAALLFWGRVSDRFGRKPVLLTYSLAFIALSFPLQAMMTSAAWTLFAAQAVALFFWAANSGLYSAVSAEMIPTSQRGLMVSGVTGVAAAIGGTAPYLSAWLHAHDIGWVFTVYLMGLSALTLVAVMTMRETKGISLRTMR